MEISGFSPEVNAYMSGRINATECYAIYISTSRNIESIRI